MPEYSSHTRWNDGTPDDEWLFTGPNAVSNDKTCGAFPNNVCPREGFGWTIGLKPNSGFVVGVHEKANLDLGVLIAYWEGDPNNPNCADMGSYHNPTTALLEVYEVTDDCVAGRYLFDPPIPFMANGSPTDISGDYFLARRCENTP